jgi:hypothetical protein
MTLAELRDEIEQQKALMVAVATGGPRIDQRQAEYSQRRQRIRGELHRRGLEDPNPHRDLWAWYGHWTANFSPEQGGYRARRSYVSELYAALLDALEHLDDRTLGTELQPLETGWGRVDHQVAQLRERYATVRTIEDCQAIGLLCRDVLRSLADATFRDGLVPQAQVPAPADAVARLGYVVDAYAPGAGSREIRKMVKAHLDLANAVQHDQDATLRDATIAAEATVTTVNLVRAIVLGPKEIAPPEPELDDDPRDWREWHDRY